MIETRPWNGGVELEQFRDKVNAYLAFILWTGRLLANSRTR